MRSSRGPFWAVTVIPLVMGAFMFTAAGAAVAAPTTTPDAPDPDADMASPAAPGEDPLRERTGISAGIPIWGAWCGPGHGGGEPEDTFDTLCMRHDRCYIERGYFDCWCDARFRDEIQRFGPQMETRERVAAAATAVWFTVTPCVPR